MSKRKQDQPTILVTDASRGSAIAIIRSLGRRGWRVIAADSNSRSPGFHSRYAVNHLLYPAPETAPHEFVTSLLNAVDEMGVELIIPVTDAAILPLSNARSRFEGGCKLALPEVCALKIVNNKLKTLELARQFNVPAPQTYLAHRAEEALDRGEELGWPLVLKPQASHLYRDQANIESFKVCYAENPDRLTERMRRFEGRCPVLLQEYYPGTGYGVELLMFQGQPLAAFQHKRLREIPINGGASSFRESVPLDSQLYEYSLRLLGALNWTGLAMVEFKVGPKGPKLMEINGRVWGSLPLALCSGMDFPARLADLYLSGPPQEGGVPDTNYSVGIRARNLELDILWIASVLRGKQPYSFLPMPSRRQGVMAFLGLLNPAYKFDILSLEDPRPGLAEIPKIARKLRRKLKEAT